MNIIEDMRVQDLQMTLGTVWEHLAREGNGGRNAACTPPAWGGVYLEYDCNHLKAGAGFSRHGGGFFCLFVFKPCVYVCLIST